MSGPAAHHPSLPNLIGQSSVKLTCFLIDQGIKSFLIWPLGSGPAMTTGSPRERRTPVRQIQFLRSWQAEYFGVVVRVEVASADKRDHIVEFRC